MKKIITVLSALILLSCVSCTRKAEKKDIIVPAPVEEVKKGPQQMSETHQSREVEWLNGIYTITVNRKVDKELPMISDENGLEYYDNSISVCVQREDGSNFVNRTFRKSDFRSHVQSSKYFDNGALLGIVFDCVKDNKLVFAASVGSPDVSSDEFIPLILTINRMGEISITPDTRMDTESNSESSVGGITGDEEA